MVLRIILFLLILQSMAFADCILSGPTKIENTNTDGEAFGFFVTQDSNNIHFFYMNGITNLVNNKIVKRTFSIPGRSWGEEIDVFTESGINLGGAKGGKIGSNIYIFSARRSAGATTFFNATGIKSTDLTGTSWTEIGEVYDYPSGARGNPDLGTLVSTGTVGEYIIPNYYHINQELGSWKVSLIRTTDSGATWSVTDFDELYSGNAKLGEAALVYLGSNRLLYHIRNNDGNVLRQGYSSDSGATWTNPDSNLTNLGIVSGVKIPHLFYDSATDRVFNVFHDRGDSTLKLSYTDPDNIINNSTGWPTSITLDTGFLFFGYASMEKVGADLYLIVYSRAITTQASTKLYWLLYKVGVCEDPGFSICGNGVIEVGEECDDGGIISGDGCSSICILESPVVCGDGILQSGEECDDGNTASGDGCSGACQSEDGSFNPGTFSGLILDGLRYE